MLSDDNRRLPSQAPSRLSPLFLIVGCFSAVTCGPALKRDLSKTPVGQVGFDDLCGVQDYFDTLEMKKAAPPKLISSAQVEGDKVRGGRSRFAFETDFLLAAVKRVLDENWRRLPEGLAGAKRVDLEVQWSDKGGLRRVVTNEDAKLLLNEKEEFALPYHVCLSEFLFGATIYHQRRDVLGLAPLPPQKDMVSNDKGDAGVSGGDGDGAVAGDGAPAR